MQQQSCHKQSERHRPHADAVLSSITELDREQVVRWFFQACELHQLQDQVLYCATLLFDRYSAKMPAPLNIERIHLLACALLSIALKVTGGTDESTKPWKLRKILDNLCQKRFSVKVVFLAECEVLHCLGFEVSSPTSFDFFSELVAPLRPPALPALAAVAGADSAAEDAVTTPAVYIATFLLQLSLLDVRVHHQYPHAALAAGAIYIALWCTGACPVQTLALLREVTPLGNVDFPGR